MTRFPKLALAFAAVGAVTLAGAPAEALEFGTSTTTGKTITAIPLGFQLPIWNPVSLDVGVRIMPFLSDMLGPAAITPGANEFSSSLIDANLDLLYRIPLLDFGIPLLGRFNPTLYPYLGYRYMGVPTSEGTIGFPPTSAFSYGQFGGIDYGVKASTEFPLGFSAQSRLGLTTLTSGGWDVRRNGTSVTDAGRVDPRGMTLPSFSVGAGWNGAGLVDLYAGYEIFALPTGLRGQSPQLSDARTFANTLYVGARILFFSI